MSRSRRAFSCFAVVATLGAFGCTAVLGVTDVPAPAAKDAGSEASDDDAGITDDTDANDAGMCTSIGLACDNSSTPGAGCCSKFCLVSMITSCGGKAGTYTVEVGGKQGTGISAYYTMGMLTMTFQLAGSMYRSDLTVQLANISSGCFQNGNKVTYTSGPSSFTDDQTAGCGLVVNNTEPKPLQGSFMGTLYAVGGGSGTVGLKLTFLQPLQ